MQVVKKDGTKIDVVVGEDENDPVIGITDLLVHLSQTQLDKKGAKVIEGEDLNVITKDITITEASDDNISFVISMGKLSPDSEEEAEPINANGIIEISEVSIIKL